GIGGDIPRFGHDNRIPAIQDRYIHPCPNTSLFTEYDGWRGELLALLIGLMAVEDISEPYYRAFAVPVRPPVRRPVG
ncbi:MAG: hypothetical protein V3U46_02445, partial [Acidimicrobiia bacterium]